MEVALSYILLNFMPIPDRVYGRSYKSSMKSIFLVLFFSSSLQQADAAPHYIVLHGDWFNSIRLKHVAKPERNLHKWSYDSKADTYYRMKSDVGIGVKLRLHSGTVEQQAGEPQYVVMQNSWFRGWRLKHVAKPTKKLHRWHYDSENNTYYRVKDAWGIGYKLHGEEAPEE